MIANIAAVLGLGSLVVAGFLLGLPLGFAALGVALLVVAFATTDEE